MKIERVDFSKIDLEGVRAVLIDIDDTLYSYELPHQEALKACYFTLKKDLRRFQEVSFDSFKKTYRLKRNEVTERLSPQGVCRSRMFAFQLLFEEANCKNAYVLAGKYEDIYWSAFIANMKVSAQALSFLNKCKDQDIRVCAVSDMQSQIQIKKLSALGVLDFIDYLTTSEEVGVEKPHVKIFEASLKKLSLTCGEVIMIGDSLNKDVKGAQSLNIKAYWILV